MDDQLIIKELCGLPAAAARAHGLAHMRGAERQWRVPWVCVASGHSWLFRVLAHASADLLCWVACRGIRGVAMGSLPRGAACRGMLMVRCAQSGPELSAGTADIAGQTPCGRGGMLRVAYGPCRDLCACERCGGRAISSETAPARTRRGM